MALTPTNKSSSDELGEHRTASDGDQEVIVNASPETVEERDWSEIWSVADRLYAEGKFRELGDTKLVRVEASDFS